MRTCYRIFRRTRPRLVLLFALLSMQPAQATELELRVKAAFLYNVAKFVDWPTTPATDPAMDLCILGDPEFAAVVRQELANKRIGSAPLLIHESSAVDTSQECQILFIGRPVGTTQRLEDIAKLQGLPVLTVGVADSFVDDGGIMRLKREAGKLRFEIGLSNLQRSGLAISSKLLRLADIITTPAS